jgi:integrase
MKKLKDVEDLETRFKSWIKSTGSESTANAYWSRIKDFKFFELRNEDEKEISGRLNKNIDSKEEKTAASQFIQFLYEEYEKDLVQDGQYEELRYKKNAIKSNLELDRQERSRDKEIDVKRHYLHKDELVEVLRESTPDRAKLYYLLYCGGFRIGELKRLTTAHIRSDYGEYGAIKVPGKSTSAGFKSEDARTVEFRSRFPLEVLEDVPKGSWEDENDKVWNDVFFPDKYAQLVNYHLGNTCDSLGLTSRTSHSFRHIRITDLVNSSSLSMDSVQKRSGHQINSEVTKIYAETSFDRPPQTLEQYLEEKDLNILTVIYS